MLILHLLFQLMWLLIHLFYQFFYCINIFVNFSFRFFYILIMIFLSWSISKNPLQVDNYCLPWLMGALVTSWSCEIPRVQLGFFCLCSLDSGDNVSSPDHGHCIIPLDQVGLYCFCTPFIYCFHLQYAHILSVGTHLCILVNTFYMYVMYRVSQNRCNPLIW